LSVSIFIINESRGKMNKALYCIVLLISHSTWAIDFNEEGDLLLNHPYLFVSLGGNCWQAQAMRSKVFGLRDAAFPFDWLLTFDNDKLIQCLDEHFAYFTDPSCFVRYENIHLENIRYSFKFTHDWPYQGRHINPGRHRGQLDSIKEKYERRIARFDSIKNFKGKVFFVRCFQIDPRYQGEPGWNADKARALYDALKRYFPDLDFELIVVSCTDSTVPEVGDICGIREYKIDPLKDKDAKFQAYSTMYADLLEEFKLL